jgi:XisH protein
MPKKDIFHNAVKRSLEKDGWNVNKDPLKLRYEDKTYYVDLGAERLIAAERDDQFIAVEIKSFIAESDTYEFHTALGQFLTYKLMLSNIEPERVLYLAVPLDTFETFFQERLTQELVAQYKIALLVYNPIAEVIEKWL